MKLPPQAKKVFSGIIFDVYQWEQKVFDGSTRVWEMIKRTAAVDTIAIVDGKILVLDQIQPNREPYPSLPGGKMDADETPEQAAFRELTEETGYVASSLKPFRYYNENAKVDFDDYLFVTHDARKTADQATDGAEKITTRLIGFDEFLGLARDPLFAIPQNFRIELFEALLSEQKKAELKNELGL